MRRPFRARRRQAHLFFLMIMVVALVVASPSLARASVMGQEVSTTQTAGISTITYSADWVLNTANPDPNAVRLSYSLMPDTLYIFTDLADPTVTTTGMVFTEFEQGVFSGFGDGNQQVVTSGMVAPSMAWQLYAVSRGGEPFGLLVTADIISSPGRVLMSILLAPVGAVGAATQVVQDTIDLNGTDSPLVGIAPAELNPALGGTGLSSSTSAQVQPTPATGQSGGQPPWSPTVAITSNQLTVAGVAVRYGDSWVYDDVSSVPDERIYLDAADTSLLRFFGLLVEEDPGIDAVSARDVYAQTYLANIGATGVQQLATGESTPGIAWSLHGAELSDQEIRVLISIDVAATAGQIQISQLVTEPEDLHAALTEAQASIQIGGAAAFRHLDPAALPGGSAASAALPEGYLGRWEGTGIEADPSETWPISVTFQGGGIDAGVGTAIYPTLDCSGDLILQRVDPATGIIGVVEDITVGEANCADLGTFVFTITDDGRQVSFIWTRADGTGSAEGILSPVQLTSQPVGASTVSFSTDWVLDADSTDAESLRLTHGQVESTAYLYMEFPDTTATDTTVVFSQFEAGFFDGFGDGNQQMVASGALSPGTDWRLYAVSRNGVPFGVLVTADVTTQPGQIRTSVLLAPADVFGTAAQAVLDTIDRNGTGSPLAGIVPVELDAALTGIGADARDGSPRG